MKRHLGLLTFLLSTFPAFGQEMNPIPAAPGQAEEIVAPVQAPMVAAPEGGGFLSSDNAFPGFIGWVSNPTKGIDPRSQTQMWPVIGSTWPSSLGPLPSGNAQIYGAGISMALSERLEIGMNNGGYAVAHFAKGREGWLDLGGFAQYTIIRDVEHQFLLSGGLQWIAPTGESDVFQGHGPAELAPYMTVGKEIGCFHVLSTLGYQFPAGSGSPNSNLMYGSLHFDRRIGWFYPVLEFNYTYKVAHADLGGLAGPRGYVDLGGVDPEFNMITVAPGFNTVLIPNRLEFGAEYQTPIAATHNFHFQEVLVKMVIRF